MRTTIALVVSVLCIGPTLAQDSSSAKVEKQEVISSSSSFVPLTTWEKFKLGGAYYTNPQIVAAVPVAYTYDAKSFALDYTTALKTLEQKKLVACGRYNSVSNAVEVIPCPARPTDGLSSQGKLTIISAKPSLLGKTADDVVKKVD